MKSYLHSSEEAKKLILSGKAPSDMEVEGWLDLEGCTSLKSLPKNLKVEGTLYLMGCTSLQSLQDNLEVEGYLDIRGCTSLKSLPDNLKVGGWLDLNGCTSLQSLPDNLEVGGWLDIGGCTSLQLPHGIPEGVKGDVYVEEVVLRNNKEYLLTMVNVVFYDVDMYKRILAEG